MQFSISKMSTRAKGSFIRSVFAAISLCLASAPHDASAESAYIQQATGGSGTPMVLTYQPMTNGPMVASGHFNAPGSTVPIPELVVPRSNGSNFAKSVTVGSFNNITQIQTGQSDTSFVSVLGGTHDNVGVLQAGNGLTSNIVLLGVHGINFDLVQRPDSAPINMLIARLPNGSILIKR
jgi:hypothetical protein